jgi:hypothetical protein
VVCALTSRCPLTNLSWLRERTEGMNRGTAKAVAGLVALLLGAQVVVLLSLEGPALAGSSWQRVGCAQRAETSAPTVFNDPRDRGRATTVRIGPLELHGVRSYASRRVFSTLLPDVDDYVRAKVALVAEAHCSLLMTVRGEGAGLSLARLPGRLAALERTSDRQLLGEHSGAHSSRRGRVGHDLHRGLPPDRRSVRHRRGGRPDEQACVASASSLRAQLPVALIADLGCASGLTLESERRGLDQAGIIRPVRAIPASAHTRKGPQSGPFLRFGERVY